MAKKFKTHAERIAKVEIFLLGSKELSSEFAPVSKKLKDLLDELSVYKVADAKQEKLKAELNLATKEVDTSAQKIDNIYRSVVDFAYSVFGKKGKELKKLGLEPWEKGGRKPKPK